MSSELASIRNCVVLGFTAFALATALAEDNPAVKKDLAQLQGEWAMLSGERDGQPLPDDFLKSSKRVAKGDEITVTIRGQLFMKAKFTIDPSKKPKTIDYSVTDGPYAGQRQLGINELKGNTVRFCLALPGKERPADFSTKMNDGRTLSEWKRDKQ